jgi:hypothetical protein
MASLVGSKVEAHRARRERLLGKPPGDAFAAGCCCEASVYPEFGGPSAAWVSCERRRQTGQTPRFEPIGRCSRPSI